MTLSAQKKLAAHIFRLLKVNEIIFPIGRTNLGNLGLKFNQNNDDFDIYLDSVPLSTKDILVDENNIELKKILEKYVFNPESTVSDLKINDSTTYVTVGKVMRGNEDVTDKVLGKKRGRPSGAKNKKK